MPTNPADRLAEIRRLCRDPETTGFWVDAMEFVLGMLDQQAAELRTLQQQVAGCHRLLSDAYSVLDPEQEIELCASISGELGAESGHCGIAICREISELQQQLAALSAEREPEKPATLPSKD